MLLDLFALLAFLLVILGACRLHRAIRANRQRRAFAEYRAACLVVTERAKLRAGQRRAQASAASLGLVPAASREWGRVA